MSSPSPSSADRAAGRGASRRLGALVLTPLVLMPAGGLLSALAAPPRSLAQPAGQPEAFPMPESSAVESMPGPGDVRPADPRPASPRSAAGTSAVEAATEAAAEAAGSLRRAPRPMAPPVREVAAAPASPSVDPGIAGFRYRLGPGDRLTMSVFMVDGYAAEVEVLGDGTVNLPRLGAVPVWGLTIEEARGRITESYERFLRNPLVFLDLVAARPVRVTMVGEVQKPGFYTLGQGGNAATLAAAGPGAGSTVIPTSGWPTLVDAVQRAGGITAVADLAEVVLTRPSPVPGGRPVEYRFDYLQLLMNNRSTVNPLLYDGDMVRVARAEVTPSSDVLVRTAASNFAPDTIGVTVVGEVVQPGLQQVRSNSPLAAAVIAAGDVDPSRANSGEIRLIRVETNGTVSVRTVALDPSAPLDSPANPSLHNGDMVVVPRNGWTRFNDFLVQAVTPLGPVLNAASIYRIFAD